MRFLRHNADKFKRKPLPVDLNVMDQHLKLQQHQAEFLEWLENYERECVDDFRGHDGPMPFEKVR